MFVDLVGFPVLCRKEYYQPRQQKYDSAANSQTGSETFSIAPADNNINHYSHSPESDGFDLMIYQILKQKMLDSSQR